MKNFKLLLFLIVFVFFETHISGQNVKIKGELEKWHKITLILEGDQLTENDSINPFLNYRLNVTFRKGDKQFVVPGFYAADGDAAQSSATKGKVWKVHFRPNEAGKWDYNVSFREGNEIAINDSINAGTPAFFDGIKGTFLIDDLDNSISSSESKGRIEYVGGRYLRYAETKKYFLKGGTDSPENFLGYYEFDQTPATHKYEPHSNDWKIGDPTWKDGRGKNIIGALNYIASKGMNSVYFLTMNVQGDGKDVWPWLDKNERYRFDCSKLDQWEVVFDHMDNLGLMLHIVLQETENELLLDIGQLGVQRKLYLRELIARFSHHLGVTWNLGEENGPVEWSPKGQDDNDRRAMAQYIKDNDPYKNYVALHTHSVPNQQIKVLKPLLGFAHLDGPSIQIHDPNLTHEITKKWIQESQKTDKKWVVALDEIGPEDIGAKPDADDPTHDEVRGPVLWGNLMAGGAGVEWYFGYKFAHMDLNCEDWRSRDLLWGQTKVALDFFEEYLPYNKMHSADGLTKREDDFVFVRNNEIYSIYIPTVTETRLNLLSSKGKYSVKWFNPRMGGKLQKGTKKQIKGGVIADIGYPPNMQGDWVALIEHEKKQSNWSQNNSNVATFDALSDFNLNDNKDGFSFYRDELNGVLAIDATNKEFRNKFASAYTIFKGKTGLYLPSLVSMAENDGESKYIISINGSVLDTITNPEVSESFETIKYDLDKVLLHQYDLIEVQSNAVSNGKIQENDETAWSRGRWSALKLVPEALSLEEQLEKMEPFEEKNGFLEVEAESFHYKTNNGTKRHWIISATNTEVSQGKDNREIQTASGLSYIEAIPDTRITHDDPLIHGENFFPISGQGGIVSYKVKINTPGDYYVWVSAFSSGTEDNGVHVGINEEWPESGSRMQWCEGKNEWTWSSAQRQPENHCGDLNSISLKFDTAGEHIISFSMREDGFKMDRWIITMDNSIIPD